MGINIFAKKESMPELPEVSTFQKYLDGTALDQKIQEVIVHDDKIIRNMSGEAFTKGLTDRTMINSYRRGKYLFARLDNGHSLLLHFGMTGDLSYYHQPEDRPRHERFHFLFDNGSRLGFDCPRKFARILLLENEADYIHSIQLGEDALEIQEADFVAAAQPRKCTIKGLLLNQKVLAGVGNLYADEVCYQCRVHPVSKASAIPTKKLKELHKKLQAILRKAVDSHAHYKEYPDDWFWAWRKDEALHPKTGEPIERAKIAGRTSYYFPKYQKLYE